MIVTNPIYIILTHYGPARPHQTFIFCWTQLQDNTLLLLLPPRLPLLHIPRGMEPHLPHDLVKHTHHIHIVPRTRLEVHASCPRGELFAEL